MNKLEKLGAHLAMLTRREFEQVVELERTRAQIKTIQQEIVQTDSSQLYADTVEITYPMEELRQIPYRY